MNNYTYKDPEVQNALINSCTVGQVLNIFPLNFEKSVCWWDFHEFEGHRNIRVPIDYFDGKFKLTGVFCSWNCAKSYSLEYKNNLTLGLLNLYRKSLGYNITDRIKKAPHYYTLKMFGGPLDIHQFRNNCSQNILFQTVVSPHILIVPGIIETKCLEYKPKDTLLNLDLNIKEIESLEDQEVNIKKEKKRKKNR